jgi:hypothetical protein
MPAKVIHVCDRCNAEDKKGADGNFVLRLMVCVDRKMEAAGSMENEHETVFMCSGCMKKFLIDYAGIGFDQARQVVDFVKKNKIVVKA